MYITTFYLFQLKGRDLGCYNVLKGKPGVIFSAACDSLYTLNGI